MTASVTTPKNLLLSVTGMSPAVVTETLYGIALRIKDGDKNAHWPDEIRIITTSDGRSELLNPSEWQGGAKNNVAKRIREVCELVGLPVVALPDEHILVVPDENGKPVEDARKKEEHEALADFITTVVRYFTQDNQNYSIHASIAGGRKTMTFYLGYAMSLLGRHGDQMSHVLVSQEFEGGGFFYPGQNEDGSFEIKIKGKTVDTRNAKVELTDIPFIRMRHQLPWLLVENMPVKKGEESEFDFFNKTKLDYRNLVDLINLGDQPELVKLEVKLQERKLLIFNGDQLMEAVTFKNQMHWAFYYQFILDSALYSGDRQDFQRPPKEGVSEDDPLFCRTVSTFFDLLGVHHQGDHYSRTLVDVYDGHADVKDEKILEELSNTKRSIASILNAKKRTKEELKDMDKSGEYGRTLKINGQPMPSGAFQQFITEIGNTLREKLPENMVDVLKPKPRNTMLDIDPEFASEQEQGEADDKGKAYLLGVKPRNIRFG